jgi:hypothetical protein
MGCWDQVRKAEGFSALGMSGFQLRRAGKAREKEDAG